ncbi:hypothetical protein [Synechococcus sp. MU1642]|uniref:hypothetical protein n=1 Tax=Synechococcus sp. MU1642 TaxID=2508348 RepID=UPI001CF8BE80|nr:hypothetical protein [Synechococcus sp. MU1642]MCB4408002.1 hypothetical protein [Synechococcus sp. MU1642]
MVDFQGFWLNLDRCEERAIWVQSRLAELHLSDQYLRISGVEGDAKEAASRGLKPGEWGAWQGWIRMLDQASRSSSPFVHLMEDDVDISDLFLKLVQDDLLLGLLGRQKVVCTDAYVSPRQCLELLNALAEAKRHGRQWLEISCGLRIPCLNSILLTPDVARRLCRDLQAAVITDDSLHAVDVELAEVLNDWSTIAPFVTSPKINLASVGATRAETEDALLFSRDALTLLRRALFCKADDPDLKLGLADLMIQLADVGVLQPY